MAILKNRHYTRNFALFDKTGLDHDPHLSWAAKGILSYVLAKPEDWEVHIEDLLKRSIDGKTLVYGALRELRHYGYVTLSTIRDPDTQQLSQEYDVYDVPEHNPHREDQATLPLSKKHQGNDQRKHFVGGKRLAKPRSEKLNSSVNTQENPHSEKLKTKEPRSGILNSEFLNTNKNDPVGSTKNNFELHSFQFSSDLWRRVQDRIRSRCKSPQMQQNYQMWIAPLACQSDGNGGVVLQADEEFKTNYVKTTYHQWLTEAFQAESGNAVRINYEVMR